MLLVFALVLPFEAPLFRLAILEITTVELVLYGMLAVAFAVALDRRGRSLRALLASLRADRLAQVAVLFAAALFVSAAAAPSDRAAAFKFALRSSSGILVFFSTRLLVRPKDVPRVLLALVAGALLSAVTAVVDRFVPASSVVWSHFHESNFASLGLIRASGVFAYPTIGAMYWEAAVPLLVVLPFVKGNGVGRELGAVPRFVCAVLGSAVVVVAILVSATRSGLAGAVVACAALVGLTWRSSFGVSRAAVGALIVTLTLGLSVAAFGSLLGQRLLWWQDGRWFRAEYEVGATPRVVDPSEPFVVAVHLKNTGVLEWKRTGPGSVDLSYHWERSGGGSATLADFEGMRTELPAEVPPGRGVDVLGSVKAPSAPGPYLLSWDLVQEGVCWFSERGSPAPRSPILVGLDDTRRSGFSPFDGAAPTPPAPSPSRPELWRAALVLWRERPLFGIGPDNFRRRYGAVLGAAPGGEPYADTRIHANSLYFETLADLGVAGIAILAWLGLGVLRLARRHRRSACVPGLGCAVAAGTFFVHGALDYFFEFTPLLGLFWLLLGLSAASDSEPYGALPGSRL